MTAIFLLYLPCSICLLSCVNLILGGFPTKMQKTLCGLFMAASVYFYAEAQYISLYEDYETYVVADILSMFARPLMPVLAMNYVMQLLGIIPAKWYMRASFAATFMFGAVATFLLLYVGIDKAVEYVQSKDYGIQRCYESNLELYGTISTYVYRAFVLIQVAISSCFILWLFKKTKFKMSELWGFLFKRQELEPAYLLSLITLVFFGTSVIKIAIGRPFFLHHSIFAVVYVLLRAAIVYSFALVALRHKAATIAIRGQINAIEPEANEMHVPQAIREAFERYIASKKYHDASTCVESIAKECATNRTYVSQLVNTEYNKSVREYINYMRILDAQDILKRSPSIKQEVLAEMVGFADAGTFNKKFKQNVGTTPRLWVLMQSRL